jgi:hypothetical protein
MLIVIYKLYVIEGLYSYSIILFILSNIMSLKIITINNFDINLGIIPFVTIFIICNIIIQKKGPNEVKKLILTLILTSLISYIILYLIGLTTSSPIKLFTNESYNNIFKNSERLYFASIVTMFYSSLINYKLYYYLKKIKNMIWVSNLFSTIIIQFIASIFFPVLAYAFIKEPIDIIKIIIIRYMLSIIISIVGTIPIYIANKINKEV